MATQNCPDPLPPRSPDAARPTAQLIELDGTAVRPLSLPFVVLNVAQRASLVLDWTRLHPAVAASPALWFRVQGMPAMYPTFDNSAPDLGLVGATSGRPLDIQWRGKIRFVNAGGPLLSADVTYADPPPPPGSAPPAETNVLAARPALAQRAPAPDLRLTATVVFQADAAGVNRAYLNGETNPGPSPADLRDPPLLRYIRGEGLPAVSLAGSGAAPFVLPYDRVVDILIVNTDGGEHPFHLHGHSFWVVATSDLPDAEARYRHNYLRRDVVSVPALGWARIRFVSDNPGAARRGGEHLFGPRPSHPARVHDSCVRRLPPRRRPNPTTRPTPRPFRASYL